MWKMTNISKQLQANNLIQASLSGDVSRIKDLLSKKVDVNCKNTFDQFPLLVASQNGHKEAVKLLIERGANVNMESLKKVTSLSLASECGHHETIQTLLENGALIDHGVLGGRTPLMLASYNGHEETVRVLLSKNANVNLYATGKETALTFALKGKHSEVAKLLLPHIVDIDSRDTTGVTPLMKASFYGLVDVTKLLLMKGARVNLRTCTGSTALMLASRTGNSEIALTLLKYGADVDLRKDDGCTALIIASQEGRKDVVKVLLSHNAEVDLRNHSSGKTALIIASENGHAEIVKYLLCDDAGDSEDQIHTLEVVSEDNMEITENQDQVMKQIIEHDHSPSANVNIIDNEGQTALSVASSRGDLEIVETLVHHGADVNRSVDEKSALSRAVNGQNVNLVRLLLKEQASVQQIDLVNASKLGRLDIVELLLPHSTNTSKDTALWSAVRYGHKQIVSKLLELGANVDNFGEYAPALVIATIREDVELVQTLLNKGAKVDVTCGRHQRVTPLMFAIFAGHKELVELFVKHGADVFFTCKSTDPNSYSPFNPQPDTFTCVDLANAMGNQKIIAILKEQGMKLSPVESDLCDDERQVKKPRLEPNLVLQRMCSKNIVEIVQTEYTYFRDGFLSQEVSWPYATMTNRNLLHFYSKNVKPLEDNEDTSSDESTDDQPQLPVFTPPPTVNAAYKFLLPEAASWKSIGTLLDIEYGKLKNIAADVNKSQDALLEMLDEWLKKVDPHPPTWDDLVEAVKKLDPSIAKQIQEKYCTV